MIASYLLSLFTCIITDCTGLDMSDGCCHPLVLPSLRSLSCVWRAFHSGDVERCWVTVSLASNATVMGVGANSLSSHHNGCSADLQWLEAIKTTREDFWGQQVKARLTPSSRGSWTAGCSDAKVSGVCTAQWAELTLAATVISSWKLLWHKFGYCSLLSRCKPGYLLFN